MDKKRVLERAPKAYENQDFIHSPEARVVRIMAEFLEPMRRFREAEVDDTVVFFGSARTLSRDEARSRLDDAKSKKDTLSESEYQAAIAKAEMSVNFAKYYEDAAELSRLLTSWSLGLPSHGRRFTEADIQICSGTTRSTGGQCI